MGRRPTARALAAYSDEQLDQYRRENSSDSGLFIWVEDPENVTEEIKQRFQHLFRLSIEKATVKTTSAETTSTNTKKSPEPLRIILCDKPYADIDPPWESHLLDTISPSTYNPQQNSPIFTKLSAELRLQVFSYVLAEYEDWSDAYKPEDGQDACRFCDYYRPGWEAPWVLDAALLYTCRRVYYEAGHLPMRLATHRFCFDQAMPRERGRGNTQPYGRIGRMHVRDLTRHNLDTGSRKLYFPEWERYRGPDPFPNLETLTTTIGWAHWFPSDPGEFDFAEFECDDWPEVKNYVRLQLEVAACNEEDINSIDTLVEELRRGKLKFKTINGTPLVPDLRKSTPIKGRWSLEFPEGVKKFDYTEYRIGNHPNPVTLEWTAIDYVPGRSPVLRRDMDLR